MRLKLNYYKKTITSAGKTYQIGLNKQKAQTLIELLTAISILCVLCFLYTNSNSIYDYYYRHQRNITENKIISILNFAKNSAVISNNKVSICPADLKNKRCDLTDWHKPIIIFYNNNNDYISKQNIIYIEHKLLSKKEDISLNKFSKNVALDFEPDLDSKNLNASLYYSNPYYTNSIIINKVGRTRIKKHY